MVVPEPKLHFMQVDREVNHVDSVTTTGVMTVDNRKLPPTHRQCIDFLSCGVVWSKEYWGENYDSICPLCKTSLLDGAISIFPAGNNRDSE